MGSNTYTLALGVSGFGPGCLALKISNGDADVQPISVFELGYRKHAMRSSDPGIKPNDLVRTYVHTCVVMSVSASQAPHMSLRWVCVSTTASVPSYLL